MQQSIYRESRTHLEGDEAEDAPDEEAHDGDACQFCFAFGRSLVEKGMLAHQNASLPLFNATHRAS